MVTLVECRGYDYKGTKTQENQGQGFLGRSRCVICGVEGAKKHGIGETERQNVEEQKE